MRSNRLQQVVSFLLLVALVIVGLAIANRPNPTHSFYDQFAGRQLVIAHQGGEGLRPSNTMAAFTHAVELGVDMLEMDVHSSLDGILVTIHDDTVDRTTNGRGAVNALTIEQLKNLDAGYSFTEDDRTFPYRDQGITIATVTELFQAFPTMPMNIEIKQEEPSIAASLCLLIKQYNMEQNVLIASFHQQAIDEFREACPSVATSAVEGEVRQFFYFFLARLGIIHKPAYTAVQVPEYGGGFHILTRRFVRASHGRNLHVHAWTINDVETMRRLYDLGVDGIITDYPDRALELIELSGTE